MGKIIRIYLIAIFITIILLFAAFSGIFDEDPKKTEDTPIIVIPTDYSSILPDWNDGEYHDYKGAKIKLTELENDFSDLSWVYSIGKSVLGRDIWCIRITNELNTSRKFSCLIDGTIHGSEWESGDACLYLAEYLLINYGHNNTISNILNKSEIYIVPVLNPDGRQKDERWNDNGVDVNRNFDSHFGRWKAYNLRLGKLFGIIKIPTIYLPRLGRRYFNCGRRPFSEPETKALRDLANSLKSKDFSFYVNCHTAQYFLSSVCNVDYKPEFKVTNQQRIVFNSILDWVEENTEYQAVYGEDYQHVGFGTAQDWFFKEFRIVSFTFEILSPDYEPGYVGKGKHDNLVHWMKTTIPVYMFLLVNMENLYNWEEANIVPHLPEGIPPEPLEQS